MIIETSKSQQIPQEITYGENLVKDNSIAPSAKRRSKHTQGRCLKTSKLYDIVIFFFDKSCNSLAIFICLDFLENN